MKTEVFPIQDLYGRVHRGVKGQTNDIIKVKILIPAYNEERSIGKVIARVLSIMQQMNVPHELVIIDDGSRDGTVQIAKELNVSCNPNRKNRGKGFSIVKGFRLVKDDEFVITMDSDGEHFPEDIPLLLKPLLLNQADMVIGSRFININGKRGGSYLNNHKKYSQLRKFGNWLFSTTMWILTRKRVDDTQSGFRAYRPGIVKQLNIQSLGFTIETEITAQILIRGGRVKEVAIHNGHALRGSYMRTVKDSFKIVLIVCREAFPQQIRGLFNLFLNF